MNKELLAESLKQCPIIAILRGITPDEVVDVCRALADNGISLIEITMNSPDAPESIQRAADYFADSSIGIGAGTVLSQKQVTMVAEAKAGYVISPDYNPEVIQRTKELGLLSIPGVFTPTEALTALRHGADFLKLFPAGHLAPEYIKDLKAVVPADFIAVGGVGVNNIQAYMRYSVGVGIGSAIYKAGCSPCDVAMRSQRLIQIITQQNPNL